MIETQSLTKRYGTFVALDDCNLRVKTGEVCGLLGPNGAGKTTLIRLLLGYLQPSSGQATINGMHCARDSVSVRKGLAYLPAEAKLFRRMRGHDALKFFAAIRGDAESLPRALDYANRLDLDLRRRVAMMSTGMRQKLALAATLAADVPLLILDEPTANLDPNVRSEVVRILGELKAKGRTILICSHVLPEVEEICDRVTILRAGRIVHVQAMNQLRQMHRIIGRSTKPLDAAPAEMNASVQIRQDGQDVVIETEGDLGRLLPWLAKQVLEDVTIEPFGLRAIYDRFHASDPGHAETTRDSSSGSSNSVHAETAPAMVQPAARAPQTVAPDVVTERSSTSKPGGDDR